MSLKQGCLYVFEGPDGVGKTTLAKELVNLLNSIGNSCMYLSFPGRETGTLGQLIYQLHHTPESFGIKLIAPASLQALHVAAHIDSIENLIIPTLRSGQNIVLDRFWWSTWVYGMVSGIRRRVLKAMIHLELEYWNSIFPTAVFLVTRPKPFSKEGDGQKKISIAYYELAEEQKHKYPVQLINNIGTITESTQRIMHVIRSGNSSEGNAYDANNSSSTQLGLDLVDTLDTSYKIVYKPTFFSRLSPAKPTEVFDTYWRFTAERQNIFFRKFHGAPPPWTTDPIFAKYKFTNAYRASDRVSQYLIKKVIYNGDQKPDEVFFRIILFKIFNRIETWELLLDRLGSITYSGFKFNTCDEILTQAMREGKPIFSAAYIMPPGESSFGYSKKHRNYLSMLERMMLDKLPWQIVEAQSMKEVFELLRSYPMIGNFLAYQFTIDINYSNLTNFSEMEFVVPGPGAKDGIGKCFKDLGGLSEADLIRVMADRQHEEFERLGLEFLSLFGRPLQLIDCQNLFCEVDKYARVAHPGSKGSSGRKRIKQCFVPRPDLIDYWYPPKWGINSRINSIKREM